MTQKCFIKHMEKRKRLERDREEGTENEKRESQIAIKKCLIKKKVFTCLWCLLILSVHPHPHTHPPHTYTHTRARARARAHQHGQAGLCARSLSDDISYHGGLTQRMYFQPLEVLWRKYAYLLGWGNSFTITPDSQDTGQLNVFDVIGGFEPKTTEYRSLWDERDCHTNGTETDPRLD